MSMQKKTIANLLLRNKRLLFINAFVLIFLLFIAFFSETKPIKPLIAEQNLSLPSTVLSHNIETANHDSDDSAKKWLEHTVLENETLTDVFTKLNVSTNALYLLLNNTKEDKYLHALHQGQKISVLKNEDGSIAQLALEYKHKKVHIYKVGNGYKSEESPLTKESIEAHKTIIIKDGLIADTRKKGLPYKYILLLSKVFSSHVDFRRDLRPGDRFTLIYKRYIKDGEPAQFGPLLAASLTNRNKTHYAFRFYQDKKNQGYFDPAGKSLKQSFDRFPLKPKRISSKFSFKRNHPVLKGTTRPHKGVDLAAAINTPIHAVSDGTITRVGTNAGYGKMIKIRHNNHDDTLYAHMNRIAKGLKKYQKVKRGQIIGYVGQTGLANGPHCHFEFHKNGSPVNPQKVSLPMAKSIDSQFVFKFNDVKEKYMEQLKLLEAASLAPKASVG